MKFLKRGQRGFSLVELMVVVGIIGVLTAIALPRYQLFQAKAKQSEVKMNLSHIHMLQTTYHMDHSKYGSFAEIGFTVQGGSDASNNTMGKYYDFTLPANFDSTATNADEGFVATGQAAADVLASCAGVDTWTIDQDKTVTNTANGLSGC